MGRYHALKPSHLYLPPPQPASPSTFFPFAPSSSKNHSISLLRETSTTALAVGDRIPGFKTSAAFLTSLHSNIFIDAAESGSESAANTPDSLRPIASRSLAPPSPLAYAMSSYTDKDLTPPIALDLPKTTAAADQSARSTTSAAVGQDGVRTLSTFRAVQTDDQVEGLHMVSDSVAQQRNTGSSTLIYHPFTLTFLVAAFAGIRQWFYTGDSADYLIIMTTFTGVVMGVLGFIRWTVGDYISEAENVGTWRWLDKGRTSKEEDESGIKVLGDVDEILLTKFGHEVIGAIIFRGTQPAATSASPGKRSRKSQSASSPSKLQIRGLVVKARYRNKGVGGALIEDAMKIGQENGWLAGGVEYAPDHANHRRVLPEMFNGAFRKQEASAQKLLRDQVEQFDKAYGSASKKR